MMIEPQSQRSASPTGAAHHHSGEECEMLYVYQLNWENKSGEREYFWSAWESQADARSNGPWEVSFPSPVTLAQLEEYTNSNWALPLSDDGSEDLQNFDGIEARGSLFLGE